MTKTEHILILLGRYKYLTLSQLLKFLTSYHATQKLLKKLVDDSTLGVIKYAGSFSRANFKAENIYYLNPPTAKRLEASGYQAQYPKKRSSRIGTDFKHRIYTINIQLSYERWITGTTQTYKNYFSNSDEFETSTAIPYNGTYIVPDFIIACTTDRTRYFVGELTNGKEVKLGVDKLKELYDCMMQKLFYTTYGWDKTPRVLAVLETDDLLRLTLKRVQEDSFFAKLPPVYLFNTIENVTADFDVWVDMQGNEVRLSGL